MAKISLKGNLVNTNGELPSRGSKAPAFTLVKTDLSEVGLNNYINKKKIINIFPSIDTSVCSTSVKTFSEKVAGLNNVVVLNISLDTPFAQQRFYEAAKIECGEMLSAFRSSFPDDYGIRLIDGALKGLTARAVVLVDEDGVIEYSELVEEITNYPNYEKVLARIKN